MKKRAVSKWTGVWFWVAFVLFNLGFYDSNHLSEWFVSYSFGGLTNSEKGFSMMGTLFIIDAVIIFFVWVYYRFINEVTK